MCVRMCESVCVDTLGALNTGDHLGSLCHFFPFSSSSSSSSPSSSSPAYSEVGSIRKAAVAHERRAARRRRLSVARTLDKSRGKKEKEPQAEPASDRHLCACVKKAWACARPSCRCKSLLIPRQEGKKKPTAEGKPEATARLRLPSSTVTD